MDWITDAVVIGTREEAQDKTFLGASGIRSILSLDSPLCESDSEAAEAMETVCIPLRDGSGNDLSVFRSAVESLTRLAAAKAPVLVHCQFGRSRSPAVVAAYLMTALRLDPNQALEYVASKRTISVSAALIPFLFMLYPG